MCFFPAVDKAEVHRRQKKSNTKNLIRNKALSGQALGEGSLGYIGNNL